MNDRQSGSKFWARPLCYTVFHLILVKCAPLFFRSGNTMWTSSIQHYAKGKKLISPMSQPLPDHLRWALMGPEIDVKSSKSTGEKRLLARGLARGISLRMGSQRKEESSYKTILFRTLVSLSLQECTTVKQIWWSVRQALRKGVGGVLLDENTLWRRRELGMFWVLRLGQ